MIRSRINEKLKEQMVKEKEEPLKVSRKKLRQRKDVEERNVVTLSKGNYAKYKKARNIMAKAIGQTSELLHKKEISKMELASWQLESAKKAIRATNLFVARRAWTALYMNLLATPKINDVPLHYEAMTDYWVQYGGPKVVMSPKKEKPKKGKKDE